MTPVNRRTLLAALGSTAVLPAFAHGAVPQSASLLPLRTPKIDHLDVIVPHVDPVFGSWTTVRPFPTDRGTARRLRS